MSVVSCRQGCGRVPAPSSLLSAALKELLEIPPATLSGALANGLGKEIDFTKDGLSMDQFRAFFEDALTATKKIEPIVESGNKYGVSTDFARMNGEVLLQQVKCSAAYKALSTNDRMRADEVFAMVCLHKDLRNRNPLHPTPLDTAVLGNLVNFPKHLFGFPFGGYATSGNEALSLCLFSYRQETKAASPQVLYVRSKSEVEPSPFISACCERLGMDFVAVDDVAGTQTNHTAVVMTSFSNPQMSKVVAWASSKRLHVHIHVLDSELREIFVANPEPVHFQLPQGVRSMSLHEGMLNCGFQVYRDARLRDLHCDVPYHWQAAYMSPNEGGSGNSTPLFLDFCFVFLGWSAMRDIATKAITENTSEDIQPLELSSSDSLTQSVRVPEGVSQFDEILSWARSAMDNPELSKQALEMHLVEFQRNFVGGKGRSVEAVVTSGGTRSINLSFESVLLRARKVLGTKSPLKVVTGNPHLAVERAGRRFQFEVVRTDLDGVIVMDQFRHEIADPNVIAVYAQTLSFTDGITDPLAEIIEAMEEENVKRQARNAVPLTLINDSCLAFSVLIHNDGQNGNENYRVLDMTQDLVTPTIVMLDAHKHLGADKGISMTVGTPGTLTHLTGHVRVGAGPCRGEIIRAIADLSMISVNGYYEKYHSLVSTIDHMLVTFEANGMKIINSQHRRKGSTVFSIEDPSAVMGKQLKKRGHGTSLIYALEPSQPNRCQSGFQLSLTPHSLREMNDGRSALEVFAKDAVEVFKRSKETPSPVAGRFAENSLVSVLLAGGNEECLIFQGLRQPGIMREIATLLIRRLYSAILDSGESRNDKYPSALKEVSRRAGSTFALLLFFSLLRRFVRRAIRRGKL